MPVALVASPGPMVIGVHDSVPAKTLPALIALARRQPGSVSFASAGVGNALHLAGEMLAQQTGVQLLHIPYKGAAPALNDLAGGQVQMMFNSALALAPFVKEGRVRLLAQTGAKRSSALPPDLPTVSEALALPGFEVTGWFGLVAHATRTRRLRAGTVIGSGTVSNTSRTAGSACIAERRVIEMIDEGAARTGFMRFGDRVRMAATDAQGGTPFGVIDQRVVPYRSITAPA